MHSPATLSLANGSTALPTGLTLVNNGSGVAHITGTPVPGTGNVYDLTISATNGSGSPVTETYVLSVDAIPVITSAATSSNFLVGESGLTYQLTASGFPASDVRVFDPPAGSDAGEQRQRHGDIGRHAGLRHSGHVQLHAHGQQYRGHLGGGRISHWSSPRRR